MGVFEMTKSMMETIVAATHGGAITVIGGRDTATACTEYKTEEKVGGERESYMTTAALRLIGSSNIENWSPEEVL